MRYVTSLTASDCVSENEFVEVIFDIVACRRYAASFRRKTLGRISCREIIAATFWRAK